MSRSSSLADLVGDRGVSVVEAISDPVTRERVAAALQACAEALRVVDELDLEEYEMAELDGPDISVWDALAPDVRDVLLAVQHAIAKMSDLFPSDGNQRGAPDAFDLDEAFHDADDEAMPEPLRDNRAVQIDEIVHKIANPTCTRIAEDISALAHMLNLEVRQFGERLRSPRVVLDRWMLLSELQELRTKCTKFAEAIAAAILCALGEDDLDVLFPRYRTEARRGAALRAAVTDLHVEIERRLGSLRAGGWSNAATICFLLQETMSDFAASSAYRVMRPLDKREFIRFHTRLRDWRPNERQLLALEEALEGFSKYLEMMRCINNRVELAREDLFHLEAARSLVESGRRWDDELSRHLELAYGRHSPLDAWLRARRKDEVVPGDDLRSLIEAALATIGIPR